MRLIGTEPWGSHRDDRRDFDASRLVVSEGIDAGGTGFRGMGRRATGVFQLPMSGMGFPKTNCLATVMGSARWISNK